MQTLFAILHITGAVVATFALGTGLHLAAAALQGRRTKRDLAEAALSLGIPVSALEDPENIPKLVKYSYSKFNSELFRNRISDLTGLMLKVWSWLGITLQIVLLVWVIYETATAGPGNAPYAWFIVALELLFPIIGSVVSLFCRVLTGRYPGQAHCARASLSMAVDAQSPTNA